MKHKNLGEISTEDASQVLQNVLNACNMPPSTLPIDIVEENLKHRRLVTRITQILAVVAALAFAVIPFLYFEPSLDCKVVPPAALGAGKENLVVIDNTVVTLFPVQAVSFTLDNQPLSYTRQGDVYRVEAPRSGTYIASVTTWGGKTVEKKMTVQGAAAEIPSIERHSFENSTLTLWLAPGTFDIDYDAIYAMNLNGDKILPSSIDRATGEVQFENVENATNFFIPDVQDHVLQAVITVK